MSLLCFGQACLEHPVSPEYPAIAPPSFPCRPGSSILIYGHIEGQLIENKPHHATWKELMKGGRSRVTIDMLPDVALLEIFDVYIFEEADEDKGDEGIEAWQTLVHVCQKWRNVVFGSPRRLNLRLFCSASTPVRETLDVWPLLPIVTKVYTVDKWDNGNIIAALEHNDRICQLVIFDIPSSEREKALAALQQPFPALRRLQLVFHTGTLVIPASFLGGFAPALQTLSLDRVPFPGLPKLLLSATHLVDIYLRRIPHSGYISPEVMVTVLSVLTRLERLYIGFKSPRSRPDWRSRHPPPRIRILLPVLTWLGFKGVAEYLDILVARIDAPRLNDLTITFFHQLIFDSPQLTQFISCTTRTPIFEAHDEAHVEFSDYDVVVTLPQAFDGALELELRISCRQSDWQLSSAIQVCGTSFPQAFIPTVERLYVESAISRQLHWQDDIENSQWLEFFHPFTAVKELYISLEFMPDIVRTLKELVGARVTEVLPTLETVFLEEPLPLGPVQEAIEQFVAARQLAGLSLAISRWEREEDEWLNESGDD